MNNSDLEDDELDWNSEDDREIENMPVALAVVVPGFDHAEASSSGTKSLDKFIKMGFSETLVAKVLQEVGDEDNESAILDSLLTYSMLESSSEGEKLERTPETSPEVQASEPDNVSTENEDSCFGDFTDFENVSDNEDLTAGGISGENETLITLKGMGYSTYEASTAIVRCGPNASLDELMDFISAAQVAKENDSQYPQEVHPRMEKKRRFEQEMSNYKKKRGEKKVLTEDDELIRPPNPMIGFGVPSEPDLRIRRNIPKEAVGPPYFYYENVALAPKGVWTTISRFLYDTVPEFVDSKYFCAAARKRGYVHNLPIENRYPLLPLPPNTVTEALPMTRRWWPAWDPRTKLNCLQTCIASAKLTERLLNMLRPYEGVEPPLNVQKEVLYQCRKWNLVWMGINKLAPLECDEVEMLLGFPRNHTRGGGISRTDRYKSLGNSFQVDTVAYHLSVLREKFPKGVNVLSLFTGIGGAEVALHRLGITLKNVVSVEKERANRDIMQSWWEQTNQRGNLIHMSDVQLVDEETLAKMMSEFGAFDLVVGGSPCNNLAGSNRHHRVGLEGKESSLFYEYFRILELVKNVKQAYAL